MMWAAVALLVLAAFALAFWMFIMFERDFPE